MVMNNGVKVFSLAFLFLISSIGSVLAENRFVDNKDGTIVDSSTALMWQKSDDGVERTWVDAVAYCEALKLAGYEDWFLPKVHMLEGLLDSSFSPTVDPLFALKPSYYWSSSESRNTSKSAKYVNFFYGNTYAFSKDNTYYAICARNFSAAIVSPLMVAIETKVQAVEAPFEVAFSSKITGGTEPYFYEWDFDDGNFSGKANPTHSYEESGLYRVMLTISDNDGSIAAAEQEVAVPAAKDGPEVEKIDDAVKPLFDDGETKQPGPDEEVMHDKTLPVVVKEDEAAIEKAEGEKIGEAKVPEEEGADLIDDNTTAAVLLEETAADVVAMVEDQEVKGIISEEAQVDLQEVQDELAGVAEAALENSEMQASEDGLATDANATAVEEIKAIAPIEIKPEVSLERGAPVSDKPREGEEMVAVAEAEPSERSDEVQSDESAEMKSAAVPATIKGFMEVFASRGPNLVKGPAVEEGLLAYSFVNAMNGDADWNKDGQVTAHELKGYLSIVIDNLSGGRQESLINNSAEDFPVCAEKGDTYLMTVGVNSSWEEEGSFLDFAGVSTAAVSKIISEKCPSWKQLQLSGSNASRNNIYRALLKINQKVGEADNFIFYFAGNSTQSSSGDLFLYTYDAVSGVENLTGIDLRDLNGLLNKIPAANRIMMYETAPNDKQ